MKHTSYSHCGGDKALSKSLRDELVEVIESVTVKPGRKKATAIREAISSQLRCVGWSGEVPVSTGSDITITSMKGSVGLCIQTGNVARIYADLIKLQTLYLDNSIKSAVIILPSQPMARLLGSNIAQANRLERELVIFKKAYHVPTTIIALE